MANKFVEGLLGGYIGYKQGQDRRKREDRQNALYDAMMSQYGKKSGGSDAAKPADTPKPATSSNTSYGKTSEPATVTPVDSGSDVVVRPLSTDPLPAGEPLEFANGGMVKPMPKQHDRFGWQKQSFKKGTLSPEEEMAAHMLVIEASLKKSKGRRK